MNKFEVDVREGKRGKAAYYGYGPSPEFQVTYTPIRSGIFNIYLFGEIEDSTQFIYAIEALQSASEGDTVILHLSTNGGSLDATDTFIMALQDTAAKVIVRASGGVHSAGTVILLQADEFYLSENFNALVHNGSVGPGGKFSDWVAHSRHTKEYMETIMRRTYEGFLTPEELDAMISGKDFWMDGKEFADRFQARYEYLQEKEAEVQEAMVKALEALSKAEETPAPKPKRSRKNAESAQ